MRFSSTVSWAVISAMAAILLACGGADAPIAQLAGAGPPANGAELIALPNSGALDLPAPSELKQPAESGVDCYRLGADYEAGLPHRNVAVSEDTLEFNLKDAAINELSFAMFSINMEKHVDLQQVYEFEESRVYLDWHRLYIELYGEVFVGLANYGADRWDWFATELSPLDIEQYTDSLLPADGSPYFSGSQPMLAVVVVIATENIQGRSYKLDLISAGGCRPFVYAPSHDYDAVPDHYGYSGKSLEFKPQLLRGSKPLEYSWSFGGGAEPNTSSSQYPNMLLGTVGEYACSVEFSNAYGPSLVQEFNLVVAEPLDPGWAYTWHVDDEEYHGYDFRGMAGDDLGNTYVTGWLTRRSDNYRQPFVVYRNSAGELQWVRTYGSAANSFIFHEPRDIAATPDGGAVLVMESAFERIGSEFWDQAVLLIRINSTGQLVWAQGWGETLSTQQNFVATGADGGIYVATSQRIDNSFDLAVLAFDSQGECQWAKVLVHDMGTLHPRGIAVSTSNQVYVAGNHYDPDNPDPSFVLRLSAAGELDYIKDLEVSPDWVHHPQPLADGSVIIAGGGFIVPGLAAAEHLHLAKLDDSGQLAWCRTLSGMKTSNAESITLAPDGSLMMAGTARLEYSEPFRLLLLKASTEGSLLDATAWCQPKHAEFNHDIAMDSGGAVYIGGAAALNFGYWQELNVELVDKECPIKSISVEISNLDEAEHYAPVAVDPVGTTSQSEYGILNVCVIPE